MAIGVGLVRFVKIAAVLSLVSGLGAAARPVARAQEAPGILDARAGFERLKKLAGEWRSGRDRVQYRVAPGGGAVIETLYAGTGREMINVYLLEESDQLVLTHYCALGNQPRMKFERSAKPSELKFSFAGGTNLNPEKDFHLRWEAVRFLRDDCIESDYAHYKGSNKVGAFTLSLSRKK